MPDCVVYAAMLADDGDVRAPAGRDRRGVAARLVPPRDTPAIAATQAAAQGGATLHGTGIHPGGITEQLPLVLSGFCRDIRHVRAEEFSDLRTYATEFVVRDIMMFGRTPDEAAGSPMVDLLGAGFGQSVRLVAQGLGWELIEPTHHEMAVATEPIDTPVGVLEAGTVAAQWFRWRAPSGCDPVRAHGSTGSWGRSTSTRRGRSGRRASGSRSSSTRCRRSTSCSTGSSRPSSTPTSPATRGSSRQRRCTA